MIFGLGRGSILGVFFYLVFLLAAKHPRGLPELRQAPLIGAVYLIAGFGVAGMLLLAIAPSKRALAKYVGVAVLCLFPIFQAVALVMLGWTRQSLTLGVLCAAIVGTVVGSMAWAGIGNGKPPNEEL